MSDLIFRAEALARARHDGQTRKGAGGEPYIVHVEEVARLTAAWGGGDAEIAAAWLHDTVEDCPPTSVSELAALFGVEIAAIVAELTDDKGLPKHERKRLQIDNAPGKSAAACLVKLADKTSNVTAIGLTPPEDWSSERRHAYLDWAEAVVAALPHGLGEARAAFAGAIAAARAALAR
ncbi:MAG: HD domain-containing protein [Paracoccaceae bacterium]|nr:HD domain-containing protein [Paracoccaceae bacterium]